MHRGYFKVWRKIEDNAIWSSKEPFCKRAAWIDLLRMVWWKEKEYLLGKNVYHLEPGEIIISIRYLAEHWRWSTKKVQDFLKVLLQLKQITTKIHPGGTQITVCHWEEYQQEGHAQDTQKLQGGHGEVTKPIKKEVKKVKELKEKTSPDKRVGRLYKFFLFSFKDTFGIEYDHTAKPGADNSLIKQKLKWKSTLIPAERMELALACSMANWLMKQSETEEQYRKHTIAGWFKDFGSIVADVDWQTVNWAEKETEYEDDQRKIRDLREVQTSRLQKDSPTDASVSE